MSWVRKFIPIILFFIGLYLFGIRLVGVDFDGIPGDMGDGRLNNYFLEHGYQFITGKVDKYWDASFFYPTKSTISMSDNLLGTLPIYSIFRAIGFDRETSYQCWFLVIISLNYILSFWTLKKLTNDEIGSSLGAYVFSFGLIMIGGISHIQMYPKFFVPVTIYFLYQFYNSFQLKYFIGFIYFFTWQMYSGIYLGFLLMIFLFLFTIVFAIQEYKNLWLKNIFSFIKEKWMHLLMHLVINIILLIVLLIPYIYRSKDVNRGYVDITDGIPSLYSYFFPIHNSLFWDWLRPIEKHIINSHEHHLFGGIFIIIAILFSVYLLLKKKITFPKVWIITFIILFTLTLKIYRDVSLYVALYYIPGLSAIRAVSRIIHIQLFIIGLLIAYSYKEIVSNYIKSNFQLLFSITIVFLFLLDNFTFSDSINKHSKKESQERISKLKTKIKNYDLKDFDAFVYTQESDFEVYKYHVDAMLLSQEIGLPTINGYSGMVPFKNDDFFEYPSKQSFYKFVFEEKLETNKVLILE